MNDEVERCGIRVSCGGECLPLVCTSCIRVRTPVQIQIFSENTGKLIQSVYEQEREGDVIKETWQCQHDSAGSCLVFGCFRCPHDWGNTTIGRIHHVINSLPVVRSVESVRCCRSRGRKRIGFRFVTPSTAASSSTQLRFPVPVEHGCIQTWRESRFVT